MMIFLEEKLNSRFWQANCNNWSINRLLIINHLVNSKKDFL